MPDPGPVGRSTGSAAIAAAVVRYYQVRFAGSATRVTRRRIGLASLGIVLTVVVAVTVVGVVIGHPWWGPIALLAGGMSLGLAGLLLALVALKRIGVIGGGSAVGRSLAPPPPANRRTARSGAISAGERAKIETLERLYLHRKAVVDRSSNPAPGPESEAWSDMVEAKVKLGLCGWPGCRNRDWAYSFCADHDSRRTRGQRRVV